MTDNDNRTREIRYYTLDYLDKHGSTPCTLLHSRLDNEFDLEVNEYAPVMDQLRTLKLVESFDCGYDTIFEITRRGVCALVDDEPKRD